MDVLLVDGYNIIGDWEELKAIADEDMSQARDRLIEIMAEYQVYSGYKIIIVFDAYEVPGMESKLKQFEVEVIYTKEKETADERIERLVGQLKNVQTKVYVATSDFAEQRTVFGKGALRKSARELFVEWQDANREIDFHLEEEMKNKPQSKIALNQKVLEKFEKMRRGEK